MPLDKAIRNDIEAKIRELIPADVVDFGVTSLMCGTGYTHDGSREGYDHHWHLNNSSRSFRYKNTTVSFENGNLLFLTDGPGTSGGWWNPGGARNSNPSIEKMVAQQKELFEIMSQIRDSKKMSPASATCIGFSRGAVASMQLSKQIESYINTDNTTYVWLDPVAGQLDSYVESRAYREVTTKSKCLYLQSTNLHEAIFKMGGFGPTSPKDHDNLECDSVYGTHGYCVETPEIWYEIRRLANDNGLAPGAKIQLIRDKAKMASIKHIREDVYLDENKGYRSRDRDSEWVDTKYPERDVNRTRDMQAISKALKQHETLGRAPSPVSMPRTAADEKRRNEREPDRFAEDNREEILRKERIKERHRTRLRTKEIESEEKEEEDHIKASPLV